MNYDFVNVRNEGGWKLTLQLNGETVEFALDVDNHVAAIDKAVELLKVPRNHVLLDGYCNCEFDPFGDDGESYHYLRTCRCGYSWHSTHCIHEARTCPECNYVIPAMPVQ